MARERSELGFVTRIQYPGRFAKTGDEIGEEGMGKKRSGGSRGDRRPKLPSKTPFCHKLFVKLKLTIVGGRRGS
jgi:hypothetical protein